MYSKCYAINLPSPVQDEKPLPAVPTCPTIEKLPLDTKSRMIDAANITLGSLSCPVDKGPLRQPVSIIIERESWRNVLQVRQKIDF